MSFRDAAESILIHCSDENLKMKPLPSKARPQTADDSITWQIWKIGCEPANNWRIRYYCDSTLSMWTVKRSEKTWSHAPLPTVAMVTARSEESEWLKSVCVCVSACMCAVDCTCYKFQRPCRVGHFGIRSVIGWSLATVIVAAIC